MRLLSPYELMRLATILGALNLGGLTLSVSIAENGVIWGTVSWCAAMNIGFFLGALHTLLKKGKPQ